MSNSNLFDVENIKLNNLDVNKLFHIDLSYNFEGLTSAIEALIFAQKFNNQRLSLLEKYNIERNERLEKQEVKNEILNETSLYIHNFVGEKEDFKKSFEEMKENLKEQERIKLEKIEKEAKKQREELEQSIINIYKNYNPIKDESNKDQELLKKGFTIIEKEIFNINDKDQKFNKNENLEKTKIKEKEINLNKENSEENEHKNISNKGTTDCSKRFRKLEKELLNIREKLKKYKNKEIIEEIKNLMDQDREKKKKNKLKIKPKNLDSDANDIAMIKNDNIDMNSSTINQKDNIENNLDMEKKRNSIDDNNKNSGDEEDVDLKDKKKIINGNLSVRKMSQNDFSDILLIKNEIRIINNLLGQNSLSLSIKNLKERLDKLEKSSDDFNSNTDLQIIDQFLGKSKDGDNHGDFIRPILESFEKRIANKMQHNEEKFRRNDDEIYKLKNDMFNVKMTIETHNKLLNELKNDFTSHDDKLKDNAKSLKELDSHIKEYISAQVLLLQNYINVKLGDFNLEPNLNITPRIEEGNDSERSKNITATDDKIRKKIGELEKNFRILLVKFNSLDKLFKDVALLTDDMNKKVGKTEFNEIKEQMYNNTNQLIFLKDNVIQLMEDRNILEEVTKLRKKFEIINATVMGLKPHTEDSSPSHRGHIESLRYVEITTFNDFQKQLKKELEFLLNRINDIRNTIDDDLIVNIQKRASIDELKSLEDFLILKLEELKQGSTKKFADKNEVGKNIRYLDSQVKHIMDVYIKKMEKGDNWLLAKKPINGHVCASCENYLGDLHDNNQFVPWNKVTHQDRIYRIGSGFSRMLQNLNVDGNEKQNEDNDKFHSRNKSNQPLVPRISSFRSSNKPLENSMDVTTFDNKIEHSIPEVSYDDPNKPKVVKIYKVKKDKKDDK